MAPPSDSRGGLSFVFYVFDLDGVFDFHIAKLFGIKDFAALKTLDKLGVFVAGDDSNLRVSAGGSHRS